MIASQNDNPGTGDGLSIGGGIARSPAFHVPWAQVFHPVALAGITGGNVLKSSETRGPPGQFPIHVVQDKALVNSLIQGRKVNPKTTHQKPELLLDIPNFNHEKPRLESSLKSSVPGFSGQNSLLISTLTFMAKMRLIA